jgi:hypothetical protein
MTMFLKKKDKWEERRDAYPLPEIAGGHKEILSI